MGEERWFKLNINLHNGWSVFPYMMGVEVAYKEMYRRVYKRRLCLYFSPEQFRGHKSSGLAKLLRILVRVPVLKSNARVPRIQSPSLCSELLVLTSLSLVMEVPLTLASMNSEGC